MNSHFSLTLLLLGLIKELTKIAATTNGSMNILVNANRDLEQRLTTLEDRVLDLVDILPMAKARGMPLTE